MEFNGKIKPDIGITETIPRSTLLGGGLPQMQNPAEQL
jgi:hypothetical protein